MRELVIENQILVSVSNDDDDDCCLSFNLSNVGECIWS